MPGVRFRVGVYGPQSEVYDLYGRRYLRLALELSVYVDAGDTGFQVVCESDMIPLLERQKFTLVLFGEFAQAYARSVYLELVGIEFRVADTQQQVLFHTHDRRELFFDVGRSGTCIVEIVNADDSFIGYGCQSIYAVGGSGFVARRHVYPVIGEYGGGREGRRTAHKILDGLGTGEGRKSPPR